LTIVTASIRRTAALDRVRTATGLSHARLEQRLDAVSCLADPSLRDGMIARYAVFHLSAEVALAPHLERVPGLDFAGRSRAGLFDAGSATIGKPHFPRPASRAEALGLFYVIEGSTLGGRMILRALADVGVSHPALAFLDPYGAETGTRWRAFLAVLERETAGDGGLVEEAVRGAVRGFDHAETVLCGAAA
jgi:heme oxygenase